MPRFIDGNNEWAGDMYDPQESSGCEPPDGGIALRNLSHQNFNFAKDVRVIGLWITFEKFDRTAVQSVVMQEKRFYVIDRNNFLFNCVEQLTENELNANTVIDEEHSAAGSRDHFLHSINRFPYYRYIFGIKTHYTSVPNLFPPNSDIASLTINQSYLFTRYANTPPHEPSGGLNAARFYPLIHTDFVENTAFDANIFPQYKVKSVRFDYRVHLNLDQFHGNPRPGTAGAISPNYAGVFKDHDSNVAAYGTGILTGGTMFPAVEKPLIFEINGKGYVNGSNVLSPNSKGWDNIHWWGKRTKDSNDFFGNPTIEELHISAPGGFHAVHFHWRWGSILPANPQFNPGHLLIDPAIRNQTLKFAVVKFEASQDPMAVPLANLSMQNFFDLFNSSSPEDISHGENIVMWVSVEVNKTANINSLNGTFLIHGFFFAHNPEQSSFGTYGTTDAEYHPRSESEIRRARAWER